MSLFANYQRQANSIAQNRIQTAEQMAQSRGSLYSSAATGSAGALASAQTAEQVQMLDKFTEKYGIKTGAETVLKGIKLAADNSNIIAKRISGTADAAEEGAGDMASRASNFITGGRSAGDVRIVSGRTTEVPSAETADLNARFAKLNPTEQAEGMNRSRNLDPGDSQSQRDILDDIEGRTAEEENPMSFKSFMRNQGKTGETDVSASAPKTSGGLPEGAGEDPTGAAGPSGGMSAEDAAKFTGKTEDTQLGFRDAGEFDDSDPFQPTAGRQVRPTETGGVDSAVDSAAVDAGEKSAAQSAADAATKTASAATEAGEKAAVDLAKSTGEDLAKTAGEEAAGTIGAAVGGALSTAIPIIGWGVGLYTLISSGMDIAKEIKDDPEAHIKQLVGQANTKVATAEAQVSSDQFQSRIGAQAPSFGSLAAAGARAQQSIALHD